MLRGGWLSSPAYLGLRGQQDERRVTASKVVTATEYASLVSFSRLGVTCQCRWPPVTLPPLFGVRCGVGGNSEGRSVACDARWWPGGEQVPKRVSLQKDCYWSAPLSLRGGRDGTGHLGTSPTLSPCWLSLPLSCATDGRNTLGIHCHQKNKSRNFFFPQEIFGKMVAGIPRCHCRHWQYLSFLLS